MKQIARISPPQTSPPYRGDDRTVLQRAEFRRKLRVFLGYFGRPIGSPLQFLRSVGRLTESPLQFSPG